MFQAINYAVVLVRLSGGIDEGGNRLRVGAERALIVLNVGDGRKIYIHADRTQSFAGAVDIFFRGVERAAQSDRLLRRRRLDHMPQSRNAPALFVDCDEQRNFFLRLQLNVLDEPRRLLERIYISRKQNHSAEMKLPQHIQRVLVDVRPVDSDHHHLPDFFRQRHRL